MKESRTTTVLRDLAAQFQEHDVELSRMCSVLAIQLTRLAQLQAEVDVLQGRGRLDARPPRVAGVGTLILVALTAGAALGGCTATKSTPEGTQPVATTDRALPQETSAALDNRVRALGLGAEQQRDLVEYLKSL